MTQSLYKYIESSKVHHSKQNFSIPNAAQIFHKIETNTHKVSNEILENQRLSKELQAEKKNLVK